MGHVIAHKEPMYEIQDLSTDLSLFIQMGANS